MSVLVEELNKKIDELNEEVAGLNKLLKQRTKAWQTVLKESRKIREDSHPNYRRLLQEQIEDSRETYDENTALADKVIALLVKIDAAPHEYYCLAGKLRISKCTCWKAAS